ncbi:MAG TPA: efflux RND transporter periplasmic adaptor subunit [Thermoanaerobaculia bacterium]|nr:efflux RND transporter periplasmic adaptor subunit [Thermoanaerobaculia bacterium]
MKRVPTFLLVIAGGLAPFGCGGDADSERAASEPVEVRVATAAIRPIERLIAAVGTLAAQEHSTLSSKVAGRLQRFDVDLGSEVRRGEVLARIEPRDYELRVQQAAAALAQARAELGLGPAPPDGAPEPPLEVDALSTVRHARAVLDEAIKSRERVHSLADSGIASTADLDTVEARYTVALTSYETAREAGRVRVATLEQRQTELAIARKNLADTVVTAPFDGAVQERSAALGQYVAVGTPVVTLVQADPLRLRLEVPEREAILLREGQPLRLRVDGDETVYSGRIARLSPALDERTRTLRVEADVPRAGALRAGLFARADIVIAADDPVLCVPAAAITSFAGIEKVILAQGGKAEERVVRTGRRTPECVEILAGLEPGLTVILDPGGLQTGQPVRVAGGAGLPTATSASTNG